MEHRDRAQGCPFIAPTTFVSDPRGLGTPGEWEAEDVRQAFCRTLMRRSWYGGRLLGGAGESAHDEGPYMFDGDTQGQEALTQQLEGVIADEEEGQLRSATSSAPPPKRPRRCYSAEGRPDGPFELG